MYWDSMGECPVSPGPRSAYSLQYRFLSLLPLVLSSRMIISFVKDTTPHHLFAWTSLPLSSSISVEKVLTLIVQGTKQSSVEKTLTLNVYSNPLPRGRKNFVSLTKLNYRIT